MPKDFSTRDSVQKAVTIFDVAAKAGTSTSTVSNVMKNTGHFSEKTRDAVLAAVKELHYTPNIAAQSLSSRRTNLIGVFGMNLRVLCDWPNVFFLGALNKIKGTRYSAFVINTDYPASAEEETTLQEQARAKFLCGIVLIGWNVQKKYISLFKKMDVPVVVVEQQVPETCSLLADNVKGGFLATRHLLKKGRRRVALVLIQDDAPSMGERKQGYQNALKEAGVKFSEDLVFTIPYTPEARTYEQGYALADKIRAVVPKVDAIFCAASEDAAVGIIYSLQQAGLKVPDDIAVVGYDDMETIKYVRPELTTIQQPYYEMGGAAVDYIIKAQSNMKTAKTKTILMEPKLIVRKSA